MVDPQPPVRRARGDLHRGRRVVRAAGHAARRAARPVRRAGDHLHRLPGAGAAGRRGPGHLSHHHADAGRALRHGGPRLLVLRLLVRLRDLRGRHGPVLGAQPRPRVPQLRERAAAGRRQPHARPGRHRRRLGLHVRAALRPRRPRGAAVRPGLVPQVRADGGAGRLGGGQHRRLRQAVPDHRRPQPAARLRHLAGPHPQRRAAQQQRRRRARAGAVRDGVHGARGGLHPGPRRREERGPRRGPVGHAHLRAGRRGGALRPGHPPRAGRAERGRRGGRRRGHRALRRERARGGRTGQGPPGGAAPGAAGRRRDHPRLRPDAADRALRSHPAGDAARGDGHRRAGLRPVPAARALGLRPRC